MTITRYLLALLWPAALAIASPADATIYIVQITGGVISTIGDTSTIGKIALKDPVTLTLRLDDAVPGAMISDTSLFGAPSPSGSLPSITPVTATLTINGIAYYTMTNALSAYSNYGGDIFAATSDHVVIPGTFDGHIDTIELDTGNEISMTPVAKSDNFREEGSWYFGPYNTGDLERETGIGATSVGPDYALTIVEFGFHYVTVYKEGDPVPPLGSGSVAVPEASTWMMTILGLGVAGSSLRARGQRRAIAV
ncbi:PEP-CTERM sorting domain-containing protein [Sphingomonas nostoxanthinifaciens]|uniref:PEP-CTERM sorting domain-containing protein n=1 Tax=Sphingomonas nostoxanthinifaciens TaxID=2872652 RepID=UPI001CC2142B|nr:PEP-CTERM sorting domain-containing protein [Sphingomonas nostoxanthinifaciens]UAK23461.1 PEP-CTERM sorting domain-containing protein [Sphingomonas nostoxanthinifaciens]